jgi:hypothetical protein
MGLAFHIVGPSGHVPTSPAAGLTLSAGTLQITSWSFSPNPVSAGTQTQGMVSLSGGTPPYFLWFNNTPPGCGPPTNPQTSSSPSFQFQCSPSSSGSYNNIHLDALDSAAPPNKASQSTSLTVNSNSGNGNGSGGNGKGGSNSSSILPSGLLTILTYFVLIFMATMVIIAAGVLAIAVSVSRRLRQLNETLARTARAPNEGKPPP